MKTYTIAYTPGAPDWDRIPVLAVDEMPWEPVKDISMTAQICYNADGFYVHLKAVESNIVAKLSAPLSEVCMDSCMEWFFCPKEGDGRYLNFEMNPIANTYIGIGCDRYDRIRLAPGEETERFQKKANYTADGWEVFYNVPTSFMQVFYPGYVPKSGDVVRANAYKCGGTTPHHLTWNPVGTERPDFHQPDYFGEMILE